MKILAFSDLHASRARADDLAAASRRADLVVGAGDFGNMRQGLPDAMALLAAIKAPMILVPGNHEHVDDLRAAAPRNATILHGTGTGIAGLRLFGLGYGIPVSPFGEWSCDLSETAAAQMLAECTRADILTLHSPPKGIADRTSAGQSVGSQAIHDAIGRIQPRLALCGHIHEAWGQTGRIGRCTVHNLGPRANWFELGA